MALLEGMRDISHNTCPLLQKCQWEGTPLPEVLSGKPGGGCLGIQEGSFIWDGSYVLILQLFKMGKP